MIRTQHLDATDPITRTEAIATAAQMLKEGKLVVIPTETVYGLAANGLDTQAVRGIFTAKSRPSDNPLILHIQSMAQLAPLVQDIPPIAHKLAEAFWPGPLTMVLPKSPLVPEVTSGGLDTVAVRIPDHKTAREVIAAAGVPLAAPSANLSGSPSPTNARRCAQDMDGRVDAILMDADCRVGLESTVVAVGDRGVTVLRPGWITPQQLTQVVGKGLVEVHSGVLSHLEEGERVASPGMKYRHYAPNAKVTLIDGDTEGYRRFLEQFVGLHGVFALCFEEDLPLSVPYFCYGGGEDFDEQARLLFEGLRHLDEQNATEIYAHSPKATGVGLAVYNRLIRAAGFREMKV